MFGKRTVEHDPGLVIFEEIAFIRISEFWEKCTRDPGIWGGASFDGKIFRQYRMRTQHQVFLDFWYRGQPLSDKTAAAFVDVLKAPHALTYDELISLDELLGPIGANVSGQKGIGYSHELKSAEVGPIQQNMVLSVNWNHHKFRRQYVSFYINGEVNGKATGHVAHEIHFSAPIDLFPTIVESAIKTIRSIHWRQGQAPPMSGPPPA